MREGLVLEGSSVCNDDLLFGGLVLHLTDALD